MSGSARTCEECGARIVHGAERCTLCGWRVGETDLHVEEALDVEEEPVSAAQVHSLPNKPVFCNACGWKNPPEARYCSQCGAQLQMMAPGPGVIKAAPPPPPLETPRAKSPAPAGMVSIVVGAAVALVVALFLVTSVSKKTHPESVEVLPATTSLTSAPVSGALAEQIAVLDGQIRSDTGLARTTRQREKAYLLMQSDRPDLAAMEYQAVAQSTGVLEDWRIAGDLFYDWMTGEEDASRRVQIAVNAVAAYEQVLALDPDNLGVRTDLATAYLNTGSPMKGVTEIKRVLEADSLHLDANFNYGLMLWRIGRNDQAATQFEKVMDLAGDPSEHYSRASEALRTMTMQQAGTF